MPYYKDFDECDDIFGGFFRRMSELVTDGDEVLTGIQRKLAAINLIVKFVWRDPEMTLTLDFTKDPFTVRTNDDTITPTATFTLTTDVAHKF